MAEYYDRYRLFRSDGQSAIVPNIQISNLDTDIYLIFDRSKMRLDNLSYKYYGDPNYGWLILLANPSLGSMEFEIKNGSSLRIPYPLQTAINRYETAVNKALS